MRQKTRKKYFEPSLFVLVLLLMLLGAMVMLAITVNSPRVLGARTAIIGE